MLHYTLRRQLLLLKVAALKKGLINKHWDQSNRLGITFMRVNIARNIKTTLPKTENAKHFLKFVEEFFQTANKSLAGTLMGTLTT